MWQKPLLGRQINPSHSIGRDMAACWLFNEGSGNLAYDLSKNGNIGVLTSMVPLTAWVPGLRGNALNFDGSGDHIAVQDCECLRLDNRQNGGITFVTSFNITSYPQLDNLIISKQFGSPPYRVEYQLDILDTGVLKIVSWNGSSNAQIGSISGINLNQWYHFVFTMNTTSYAYYLDGELKSSGAIPHHLYSSTNAITIGKDVAASEFNGIIDYLLVYKQGFSVGQAMQAYYDPFSMFLEDFDVTNFFVPVVAGAIMNQFQGPNLGADLYNGSFM